MTAQKKELPVVNTELILYRLDEIRKDIIEMKATFVTKTESASLKHEIEELRRELGDHRRNTSSELEGIKKRNNLLSWAYPTASAAFSALFTYLIIEFFRTHG